MTISSTSPISVPRTASPMMAQPTSTPVMASSTATFSSSANACASASRYAASSAALDTPMDEPPRAGFTKTGKPPQRSTAAAQASSEAPR